MFAEAIPSRNKQRNEEGRDWWSEIKVSRQSGYDRDVRERKWGLHTTELLRKIPLREENYKIYFPSENW